MTKTGEVSFRRLDVRDYDDLLEYLHDLGADSQKKFRPHRFNLQALNEFYDENQDCWGFVAEDKTSQEMIAYHIVKRGILIHDQPRFHEYGIMINHYQDALYAPSVADRWQGKGVGTKLFQYILKEVKTSYINRIFLWGGVQQSNEQAIQFYLRRGFESIGSFEHEGMNMDMVYNL